MHYKRSNGASGISRSDDADPQPRRTHRATQNTDQLFRSVVDALPAHTCIVDEEGTIVAVNEAWRSFARANQPSFTHVEEGANYLNVCDTAAQTGSADADAFAQGLRAVLGGGQEEFVLSYACHTPLEERWFLAKVIRLAGQTPVHALIMHENITERHRVEDRLRYHLQLTDTIANRAAEGLFLTDALGYVTYLNPAAEHMFGWELEELAGVRLHDAIHYQRRDGTPLPASECPLEGVTARGRAVHNHDDVFFHRNGTPLFVRCSSAPVISDGKITGAVLVVGDDSQRKRAEEKLRASEEKFRSLSACSPVGIFLTDHRGHCTYTNPRCQAICGFTFEQALGDGWASFVHPDDRARLVDEWTASVLEGSELAGEFRFHPPGGPERWAHVRRSPLHGDAGQFIGNVGTVEDVSQRKRLEEALRERAVRLLEADRQKDEWVSMLAHELRGPLSPVRNAVQVMTLKGPLDPELDRARDIIARHIGHMARIVEDLLDVTRLSHGLVQLKRQRLDLVALVHTVLEDHRRALASAGLSLEVETPDTPVWVQGDPTRLTQVLNNFLENSAKFTERGGAIELWLRTDESQSILTVSDTGCGIDTELLPRLFDAFTQADRSLHRTPGGLGLGLSIVKHLVEQHGGTVTAASAGPGLGADFTIRLPLEKEAPSPSIASPPVPTANPVLRILVVEDNRDAADSLRMLLELCGHEVRAAYTGPEGLRVATSWRPDVVLSDIGLPGLDGFDLAHTLRDDPATDAIRLIALTGYGSEQDRERALASGFDIVLTKPAEPAAILELLASPGTPGKN